MLQEESCKKLAAMISKSFGQSQMREFAKNCDIDLSRQIKLDEADIIIRDRHNQRLVQNAPQQPARNGDGFMYEDPAQNSMWNPDGNGDQYMGPPPEQQFLKGRTGNTTQLLKQQTTTMNKQLTKQQTVQKQTTSALRLPTSTLQHQMSQSKLGGGLQNQTSMNKFGLTQQLSGIPKNQMTRQFTRLTTIKSGNFGVQGQTGVTRQGRTMMEASMNNDIEQVEMKPPAKPIQYIKIGDIILLTLSVKVFQTDIETQEAQVKLEEGNLAKNEQFQMKQSEQGGGKQASTMLAKIIDNPNFIYKGVIQCEGINNMSLQIIPKRTEENTNNAFAQFQKCLFYVENKSRIHFKTLIQAKMKERDTVIEMRKKTAEKSDYQALAKIDQTLKDLREELDVLEQEKALEDSNNNYMTKQKLGTKIQYGEEIQLKHIFTDKYLSIDMQEMSEDHGAVKVSLQGLSPSAWIRIIPSKDQQNFRSEMLINSKDAKKFNLKIGGHINVKDAFYLMNMQDESTQKYFLHVDKSKVAHHDGVNTTLEVNAALNPTKFNAKMFLNFQEKQHDAIYSGDVVRLLHIESNCYMQTGPRLSGTRSMFSQYPDFLQAEIAELKKPEEWEGDFKTLNFGNEEESFDFDDSNQDQHENREARENEVKQNKNLFLETETRAQSFTDSCFEIQNVKSFIGGKIELGSNFRLKQTVTEMFIALDPESLYLTLREDPLQQRSTVFSACGIQNDESDLKSGSKIYLETYCETYVQIYQEINDEIDRMFKYKDFSPYDFYNIQSRGSALALIAGKKQARGEDSEPKMIFRIEKVDPKEARVTYECNSFLLQICSFWELVNTWAVVKNERAEAMYTLCYDGDAAVTQEDLLTDATGNLVDVITKMIDKLEYAAAKDDKMYKDLQRNLCEQRIVECLLYLVELIYYKTVPPEYRNKPFKPDRMLKQKIFDLSHESYLGYQIAKDHLDDLNLLLLKTIMLLIRYNTNNCERISRFADTLFNQFRRMPNPYEDIIEGEYTKKIFCHMYKCATYLYNDRGSVIKSVEGINQNMPDVITKTQQLSRWLNLLETVQYADTSNQNISQQVRYFKIISSFCKTMDKTKFKYYYQIQIVQRLFHMQSNVPLWVGTQRRTDKSLRPFVYFARLQGESSDQFMQGNNHIATCFGQSLNQDNDRKFDIIFNIDELTLKFDDIPKHVGPYFDYIAGVIQLYAAMCSGRNREAITFVRQRIGATDTFLLDQCTSHHRQHVQIVQRLKPAYLDLAKVLILEHQPFNIWSELSKNRVFFWNKLEESEIHNTVYQWEKCKYGDDDNSYGTDALNIRKSTLRIRQIVNDYIERGPQELIEFLYSSEKKQYSDTMVNPKLSQLNSYIECAIAVLTSENCDTTYAHQMMDFSVQILLAVSCNDFIDYFQDSWIYKLIRVVHRVPQCKVKEQKLILQALHILHVVNQHRLSQQVLQFLKQFKDFEETSNFSHINFHSTEMDMIFKNLFTIQQFNVDTKSLQVLFLMLDPKRKIIQDVFEEQAYESDRIRRHKLKALQIKRSETPRQQTHRDSEGNVADNSFLFTQRQATNRNSAFPVVNIAKEEEEKKLSIHEETDLNEQVRYLSASEVEKKTAQTNRDLPIDEYLLYFSLMKTQLRKIPSEALKIVYSCARQRMILLNNLSKVELLVSEDDRQNYKTIHFLKERLTQVSQRLVQEEFTYLLFKVGQHEQIKEKIVECTNVLRQLAKLIEEQKSNLDRLKIQNLIRQVDFIDLIFSQLLKTVYYDRSMHKNLFDNAMEFLFQLTFHNQQTSMILRPHLSYLAELIKWDIESGKVMACVIQTEKLSTFGMKFHQFVIRKLIEEKTYKPQLFDYLTVVSQNEPVLQSFFLSQIVGDSSFRNRLYMKKHNEKEKIEIIKELVRKRLIFGKGEEQELANDILKVNLHVSIVTFLAHCGLNNLYGLKQIRRLVELDRLMDALLAQSVPFLLKATYFRLFYSGFLQQIGNENSLAINYGKFLQIIRFVVLFDLEQFHEYFNGLVVPYPPGMGEEAMNDPEWKRSKQRVTGELERQTKETQDKLNSRKTFKQKNEEKEMRAQLSPLNEGTRPYPFLEEKNMIEYWQYLCSDNKQTGQSDGLLIFIRDMYKTLIKKQDTWVDELCESSQKLYEALLQVTDTLDNLRDMYKQYIINLDSIMLALSEATHQIPSRSNKVNALQSADLDIQDEKDDEERMEKIMVITRDYIISKNLSIREGFGIKSLTQDVLVHPYFIKRKIKDICGNDVNFHDIELMVRKIMNTTQKKQELQAVVGIELGQPGHIRTRHSAKLHERNTRKFKHESQHRKDQSEQDDSEMFNFKEFEAILKSKLQKAGFKPPIIRRERVTEEPDFVMIMEQEDLSHGCQGDLQHFIKCYWEFLHRYQDADEITDLAKKILQKFNLLFIQGSRQNETSIELSEYTKIKQFMNNLVRCVLVKTSGDQDVRAEQLQVMAQDPNEIPHPEMIERNHFLLALVCQIVAQLEPESFEKEIRQAANTRHYLLQRIVTQCGMLRAAYSFVNPCQPDEVISQALRLLYTLIANENKEVLQSLLELVKEDSFNLLVILKNRVKACVDRLLNIGKQEPVPPSKTLAEKVYDTPSVVAEPELISQPFYLPDGFTIEVKLKKEEEVVQMSELLFILKFIQNLVKGLQAFQEIIVEQDKNEQVDLVTVVGDSLIRITEIVQDRIYTSFKVSQCVQELFRTLYLMADGQTMVMAKFAKWRALQKTLNFFIEQNLVYYSADSVLSRSKINILALSLNLLTLCVLTQENLLSVICEINLLNLRSQLTTIFKFKIGGTPHRDHVYNTNKSCTHHGLCLKDEYCFFQCLVSFDLITFDCADDIFFVLQQANLLLPIEKLGKIRFNRYSGNLFLNGRDKYLNQIYWESFERIQESVEHMQNTSGSLFATESKEASELNNLLELIFVIQNQTKIERRFYKQQAETDYGEQQAQQLFSGIDRQPKLAEKDKEKIELAKLLSSQNEFVKEEEEEFQYEEVFLELIKKSARPPNLLKRFCCMKTINAPKNQAILRKLFCFSWLHQCRKQRIIYDKQGDKIKFLFEKRKLVQNAEGKIKIDNFISSRQIEIARKREYTGPFTGSLTKQILQTTTYLFDQFKYDYVYRFMLSQCASVEIVHKNGSITKETYQIPTYCQYISQKDEAEITVRLTTMNPTDNFNKMKQFLLEMPLIKMKMKQNQNLARVSPLLYRLSQQSLLLTKLVLLSAVIINMIFLQSYTYRFDPPKAVVVIRDPMEWLKETVNFKGYKRYVPPPKIIYDPWEIRMKSPELGMLIDLLAILNAVAAILAFILKQLTQNVDLAFTLASRQIKEDRFTTGSLASTLPKKYDKTINSGSQNKVLNYVMNLATNLEQIKNLSIIVLTCVGLVHQDSGYPFILGFLLFSELQIVQQMVMIMWRRILGLAMLASIAFVATFMAAYYRFLDRQCLEVTECLIDLTRSMIDLPSTESWLEFSLVLCFGLVLFNLFLGLLIDSISEVRAKKEKIEHLLNQRCFICDLSKVDFEHAGIDFKQHLDEQHNPMAYLFYCMWSTDQNEDTCQMAKVTRMTKDEIEEGRMDFIPQRQCRAMQLIKKNKEEQ